jgi:hypothetical protein
MAQVEHRVTMRALLALCALTSGCAWHEVNPRMGQPPTATFETSVAVRPVDDETAVADLQAISRRFQAWGNAKVTFPYRDDDAVDVLINVRLRQTTDSHMFGNVLRAVALGLTLGLLSPVVGPHMSEIHDVQVRSTRAGRSIGEHRFEMRTDLAFGLGADQHKVAKALDDEQMNRIAKQVLELVMADIRKSGKVAENERIAIALAIVVEDPEH